MGIKNKYTTPELIFPQLGVGVNVLFEEMLVLARVRYKEGSKAVIVYTKTIVIIKMQK